MSYVTRTDPVPVAPRYIEPKWEQIRVRVVKPFCVGGRPLKVGTTVRLIKPDALGLIAQGKAALAS